METENEIAQQLRKLAYMYELNRVIRYGRVRNEPYQTQSVSEHVANVLSCAYFFKNIITTGDRLDMGIVARRILIHDLGEIETGDVLTVSKTSADIARERNAIDLVAQKVPTAIATELINDFEAVENATDLEGRFVRAMDKFDGFFFQSIGDGIAMIRTVTPDISVRKRFLDGLTGKMEQLGFPEIVPYVEVAVTDLIARGYLQNTDE
jgi:5'-deoxynucleotidase YfbR-like HD superfamily hydrolase